MSGKKACDESRPYKIACIILLLGLYAYGEDAASLLSKAEEHYQMREQKEELLKAIESYQDALKADPSNYEAAWRLSKAYWYKGNFSSTEKKPVFEKGIEAGKKAIENDPEKCEGHFWLGINYAVLAEVSGGFTALGLVDDIKKEITAAMNINENCECGGPSRVLGKLYAQLPWFKGGSKKKAITYLKKSLNLCPYDTQSRIFLAEIYIDQGDKVKAVPLLRQVEEIKAPAQWIPETKANKISAEKMLQNIKKSHHGKD
jgi:tetratricopeptide (TPR) repeat protein